MVKTKVQARRKVQRAAVTITRRDPLAVPSRFQTAGYVNRWVRTGDNPSDTESMIEEREEMGYEVVQDPDKGGPVTKRNMILMRIPVRLYREREQAKAEENVRMNRAQAEVNRANMSQLVGRAPHGKVVGAELVREPRENLLDRNEFTGTRETVPQ